MAEVGRQMALVLLAGAALVGCGSDDPRALRWKVQFGEGVSADRARALEARILEGGCSGSQIYEAVVPVSGGAEVMRPPDLEPGLWGFAVAALDADCVRYAAGCAEVDLPLSNGADAVVPLSAVAEQPACASSICNDGVCDRPDGGDVPCPDDFADCNGDPADGCEASLLESPEHCGACGAECRVAHGTPGCEAGACAVASCDAEWADCDDSISNGCEASLRTTLNCGSCGTICQLPHAAETCAEGRCELVACHPGWADCDGVLSNGCEANLADPATCGACDVACTGATPLCAVVPGADPTCVDACPAGAPTQCGSSCVDTGGDARHCGACDTVCEMLHGIGRCTSGTCQLSACEPLWGDCDSTGTNGCETPLFTGSDCGSCGVPCSVSEAVTSCVTGECIIDECYGGFADCDGAADTGCEADLASTLTCGSCEESCEDSAPVCGVDTSGERTCLAECAEPAATLCGDRCLDTRFDVENCGGCGARCTAPNGSPRCVEGECLAAACDPNRGDCDGSGLNGCEVDLLTDPDHCGVCGNVCMAVEGAEATCVGGECQTTCPAGQGDCNGDPSDGCETPLNTVGDCGGCGIECAPQNATGTCGTGTCEIASCNSGFGDCDGSVFNGCEANLSRNADHCGSCGNRCTPFRCMDGSCV